VSASYDALVELFECLENFLIRLHIYTEKIPLPLVMADVLVKIIVEVLGVLSLATKQIKQGRFGKQFVAYKNLHNWTKNSEIRKETVGRA
jgi:hypothetical protein